MMLGMLRMAKAVRSSRRRVEWQRKRGGRRIEVVRTHVRMENATRSHGAHWMSREFIRHGLCGFHLDSFVFSSRCY